MIRSLSAGYPDASRTGMHRHDWAQLVYATEGVLAVETAYGIFVAPPQRAVWVAADVDHDLQTTGRVQLRTLYLRPDLIAGAVPQDCCVLAVSALLRELVLHVIARNWLRDDDPADQRLAQVIVDQIDPLREVPLVLPLPSDARARRVAMRVQQRPCEQAAVAQLARGAGASARTIERCFRAETGMSFGRWRTLARLLFALRRLAARRAGHGRRTGVRLRQHERVHRRLQAAARHDPWQVLRELKAAPRRRRRLHLADDLIPN